MQIERKSFFTSRTLRTEILVVFLFLIAVSSATIISFTYYKNNKLIGSLAEGTIDRVSALIVEKTECMLNDLAILPEEGAGYVRRHPDVVVPSPQLLFFLLDGLRTHPNLYAYYAGTPNGSAITTINLKLTEKPVLNDRVPVGAAYLAKQVDQNQQPPTETWSYFNEDLELIHSEQVSGIDYDPRVRPWFIGAKATGKTYWTDVFLYEATSDPGIAVAKPLYNKKGDLVVIFGADLSLKLFHDFLKGQKIGKAGNAFILDPSGKIIIPNLGADELVNNQIAAQAYNLYKNEQKKNFSFEAGGVEYLASMNPFPVKLGKDWLILVIDPMSDYYAGAIRTEHQVVLISIGILLLAALLVILFSKHISAPIVTLAHEVDKITRLELDSNRRVDSDIKEIDLMDYSIADLRNAIRSFSRYAPKQVVKELMANGKDIVLGGEKKEITILFTDIVEFTPVAETYSIEIVTSLLAEYFDLLSKIVLNYHGTIDKYIGDSIMAFWGAPQEMDDQASRACTTALLCHEELRKLNQERQKKDLPQFETLMGIHSGSVIVGNIGTSERMNYTIIGDAVNATSRMLKLNKIYHTHILISGEVVAKIGDEFIIRPLDIVEVKGKRKKITLFELMAKREGNPPIAPTANQVELAVSFSKAYEEYHAGRLSEARTLFREIQQRFPQDAPTQLYLDRLQKP